MAVLTGQEIHDQRIVRGTTGHKIDDQQLPSYGPDGCGITLRGLFLQEVNAIEVRAGGSISVKTVETVHMPTNMIGRLYIKSTYAREGIMLVTNAPVDPGYNGTLTIRLFNSSDRPKIIWKFGGLAMLVVEELTMEVEAYAGRHQGRY